MFRWLQWRGTLRILGAVVVGALTSCSSTGEVPNADGQDGGELDASDEADSSEQEDGGELDVSDEADLSPCCPIDTFPSSCMHLGGSGFCGQTCDFFCVDTFDLGKDENGCDIWLYERRLPRPGENELCWPIDPDPNIDDGGIDGDAESDASFDEVDGG